ncbi:allophanate hydrolase [Marinobacter xestospongiae]|uniref:Allophanate hydrolase n=1 Tax=Marinobacter xestospongiae TaxID=994319 RepID=A0ABU3W0V5_9GAMM|nr:allophanate hydrolase [Marinobacter xestospongiae]MDV2080172.1 allophanate hydrolase [Marinobacter xestospongiae]
MFDTSGWTLNDWRVAYQQGAQPDELLPQLLARCAADDPAWIALLDQDGLDQALTELAATLAQAGGDPARLPLYGVPCAVKDNIDARGFPTTAACPEFAYQPTEDATVVAKLKAAGAVVIGKTNLDQFATGLVGTRSPYGAVANTFDPEVISGGSSSGSASVVARGLVPFALGTDTAGSGRVPAGLNNLVGLKPTRGAFSMTGVVPACRSLDCVSVFALTVDDAAAVSARLTGLDDRDVFSRTGTAAGDGPAIRRPGPIRRLAIPAPHHWLGDDATVAAWQRSLADWPQLGIELVPMAFDPLLELAELLYQGPWVAERHAAIGDFLQQQGESVHPVVRGIIESASQFDASATFRAQYRREELLRRIDQALADVDGLLVPTAPIAPTIAAVQADPLTLNSQLGTFTNFVNLADFCALAIPAGFREDGLPFGVTLISGAWKDQALQTLASQWLNRHPLPLGATDRPRPLETGPDSSQTASPEPGDDTITVAVVGAHLSGMPLNGQLTERQAELLEQTTTTPNYRLYALPETTPPKPGLRRVAREDGAAIVVEVWRMQANRFGSFVDLVPPPLGIGNVELADGRWVKGFICEGYALEQARDVTAFGGWRPYITALTNGQA